MNTSHCVVCVRVCAHARVGVRVRAFFCSHYATFNRLSDEHDPSIYHP